MLYPVNNIVTRSNGEHLLIADDNTTIVRLTTLMLEEAGYSVHAVFNGEDAVAYIEQSQHKVDLAVMDLQMPKMSGIEAVRCIRAFAPDLPVIFSTGFGDDSIAPLIASDPAIAQIHKPYRAEQLLACIRGLVHPSRHASGAGN